MRQGEFPSERYWRLAKECLDSAAAFPEGNERTTLLQMAQVWQRLAKQHEASTPPLFQPSTVDQPVMQQQQQSQPTKKNEDKS